MKRSVLISILVLCSTYTCLYAWGIYGHQHINKAAVFALPSGMGRFFYNHIDYITEESVIPDIRKHTLNDKAEFARHYINTEAFEKPIENLPKSFKELKLAYNDTFLQKNGILPWYIHDMMDKLTKAFWEKRKTEILFLAADLGHYLGDAHMPLHTSLNHDGELSDQRGIHAFWESQLPEMFGDNYNYYTGNARYMEDIDKETWRIIKSSHDLVDSLLDDDKRLTASFDKDKIYKKESDGSLMKNKFKQLVHSDEYAKKYNDALQGMVERQMRAAIAATANYWYTAWVNAGKPDLNALDDLALSEQNKKNAEDDFEAWTKGHLTKLKSEKEF